MDRNSRSKKRKVQQSAVLNRDRQSCESGKENHEIAEFPCIPIDIIGEILSRVVIKTLLSCRLVCKTWADHINTSEFVKLHLSRSPTMCLIKPINKKRQSNRLSLIDLECPFSRTNKLEFLPKINLPDIPLGLIGSCNGLVCLGQIIDLTESEFFFNIFVCNPVLREYITLPDRLSSCAFGFNHITNQYKVVMDFYDYNSECLKTRIYTLGVGSWRILESGRYCIKDNNYNAFFKGALHFTDLGPSMYCFDFLSEEFRAFPEPLEFDDLISDCSDQMRMCILNDNLAVCDYNYNIVGDRMIIWVMKEYGVKESWSKAFVITHMIYEPDWDEYEPIFINGNGEILMIFNSDSIMLYNPKSDAFESTLKIFDEISEFRAIAHVPSLISLKDVAKGENLKVLPCWDEITTHCLLKKNTPMVFILAW